MAGINLVKQIRDAESASLPGGGQKLFGMEVALDATDWARIGLQTAGILVVYLTLHFVDADIQERTLVVQRQVEQLDVEISTSRQKLTELQEFITQAKEYERNMEELRKKLAYLEALSNDRTRAVRIVDYLASRLPEQLWMLELTADFSDKKSVSVKGGALSLQQVSDYMTNLEGSVFFPVWKLIQGAEASGTTSSDDVPGAKNFEISADLVGT